MDGEWGPWVDHDGRGRPVPVGTLVMVQYQCGRKAVITTGTPRPPPPGWSHWGNLWIWFPGDVYPDLIVRYRVRKPRGLTQLQRIAADPQPIREREDA